VARRGPKVKPIDLVELQKWARAGATIPEMANRLGVSKATLDRRLEKPKFRGALDEAKAELFISLRSKQVQLALAGNVTMLIWLGKQYLGQKDRQELSGIGKDGAIALTLADLDAMREDPEQV
jgi:hypothetical protein